MVSSRSWAPYFIYADDCGLEQPRSDMDVQAILPRRDLRSCAMNIDGQNTLACTRAMSEVAGLVRGPMTSGALMRQV
jgi:hypothetical protein